MSKLIAAAIWLLGGNLLVAAHYLRRGEPWWYGFRGFVFPWKDFSLTEWLLFLLLTLVVFAIVVSSY